MNDRANRPSNMPMTLARFSELLDAYGAQPARWPDAEREAAQQLLAVDPEAMQLRAASVALDELLDGAPAFEASAALHARVAEIPIREARGGKQSVRPLFGLRIWQMVCAGALACMIGVISGAWTAPAAADEVTTNDDGWDDVASVAFANSPGEEP